MPRYQPGDEVLVWTVAEREVNEILFKWEYKGLKENMPLMVQTIFNTMGLTLFPIMKVKQLDKIFAHYSSTVNK